MKISTCERLSFPSTATSYRSDSMNRRSFFGSTLAGSTLVGSTLVGSTLAVTSAMSSSRAASPQARRWPLGINTYCLRFLRWNDRQLMDYCVKQKLDAVFLQDSVDPGVMDPHHWAEVRSWSKDLGFHLETGGGALLPKKSEDYSRSVAELRKNVERAKAMGSPIVRALLASDRYSMPDNGPVEPHMETGIKILREVRSQVIDAGLKIAIENHKELMAWQTRQVIETAGKEFVGLLPRYRQSCFRRRRSDDDGGRTRTARGYLPPARLGRL